MPKHLFPRIESSKNCSNKRWSIILVILVLSALAGWYCVGSPAFILRAYNCSTVLDYPYRSEWPNRQIAAADASKYAQAYLQAGEQFEHLLSLGFSSRIDSTYAFNQIIFSYLMSHRDSQALHWITKQRDVLSDTTRYTEFELADYCMNRGLLAFHIYQIEAASVYLLQALRLYRHLYGPYHLRYAQCLTQLGLLHYEFTLVPDSAFLYIQGADAVFSTVAALAPYRTDQLLAMAMLCKSNRNHEDGARLTTAAIDLIEGSPYRDNIELLARCYGLRGYMKKKQGKATTAEADYRTAITLAERCNSLRVQEFYRDMVINMFGRYEPEAVDSAIRKYESNLTRKNQPNLYLHPRRLRAYYSFYLAGNERNAVQASRFYEQSLAEYQIFWKDYDNFPFRDRLLIGEYFYCQIWANLRLGHYGKALYFAKLKTGVDDPSNKLTLETVLKKWETNSYPFKFVDLPLLGEVYLSRYEKNPTTNTTDLERAFRVYTRMDSTFFRSILTPDEGAILTYQREGGASYYNRALLTTWLLHTLHPKDKAYLDWAVRFCDRQKSFLLYRDIGFLAVSDSSVPVAIPERLWRLNNAISARTYKADQGLFLATPDSIRALQYDKLRFSHLLDSVRRVFPLYFSRLVAQPMPGVSAVRATLAPDGKQGILQYHVGGSGVFGLYIDADTVVFRRFDATGIRPNLEVFNRFFYQNERLTDTIFATTAYALYSRLFQPFDTLLRRNGRQALLIIPDGELHRIPFEALACSLSPDKMRFHRMDYLYRHFDLTYAPSWKIHANHRPRVLRRTGQIGCFTYGTSRGNSLQQSYSTIKTVKEQLGPERMALFAGSDCTSRNFKRHAGNFDVLYLALHALAKPDDRLGGSIYFKVAPNGKQNDSLSAVDVMQLRLPAELVILSACESAEGKLEQGEGSYTLARAFFKAGAARVVATRWKVPDHHTAALFRLFFQQLRQNPGMSPAAVLRAARLAYLADPVNAADPKWWAGIAVYD